MNERKVFDTTGSSPSRCSVFSPISVQPPFFGDFNMKRILLVGRKLKSFSTTKRVSPPRSGEIHNEILVVKQCVLLLVVLVVV